MTKWDECREAFRKEYEALGPLNGPVRVLRPFRTAWVADLPWRAIDLSAHIVLALLLPGPWWLQWLPDVMLPVLWVSSWASNAWLPDGDWRLEAHRALHLRSGLGGLVACAVLAGGLWWPAILAHAVGHWAVDWLTHGKEWQ